VSRASPNRDRRDLNATEIIDALRQMGVYVYALGRPTDLLVGISGLWFPVEIKAEKGQYTPDQIEFRKDCDTFNLPKPTLRTLDEAAAFVNHIRRTDYIPVPF
jgi:hypothetical protein